jgi:hypothetical protein
VSAEFPEHHLLVPAAAAGNSYILAHLDSLMLATELWSEQIKINTKLTSLLLLSENKEVSLLAKISTWIILLMSSDVHRSEITKLSNAVFWDMILCSLVVTPMFIF